MIRSILLGVAGTPALQAKLFHALDLAKRHGAFIQLLSVVDTEKLSSFGPVPIGGAHYAEKLSARRVDESHAVDEQAIEACKKTAEAEGIEVDSRYVEGDPLEEIERYWRYADLLLLGLRGWFDHGLLPEPEDAIATLVRAGVRPIMAVPEEGRPIKKVLIAYNGTAESAKAMKHFLLLGGWPDCQLNIACVGKPRSGEEAHQMLDEAGRYGKRHGHKVATAHVRGGDAVDRLLEHARTIEADMIVMGGSYRRLLLADRFGRSTVDLIKRSPLPLFISH